MSTEIVNMSRTEPTGNEPWTPVKIKATSATERASFRKCRRQWFLTIVHRLESVEGNPNFWIGNLIHTGLEVYYRAQQNGLPHAARVELAMPAYQRAYDESLIPVREALGFLFPMAEDTYHDLGALGWKMLEGYFEREEHEPIFDEIVQVEHRLFVPIRDARGRAVGKLAVRTDLVGRRGDRLAVADHKTTGAKLAASMLDIDDQLSAEVYAVWKSLGEFPTEALYNALLKKAPGPPKENLPDKKTGRRKLSKAKDQPTTVALYLEEIARLGLDRADYEDILAILAEREASGESDYFYREATFRTPGQMRAFEENLYQEWLDMRGVAAHPERAYPSPSLFSCPSCPVRQVCFSMMDGGDAGAIIRNELTVVEPRY